MSHFLFQSECEAVPWCNMRPQHLQWQWWPPRAFLHHRTRRANRSGASSTSCPFFFVNANLDRPALSVLLTSILMQSCCFRGLYIFYWHFACGLGTKKKNHLKSLKCSVSVQKPWPGLAGPLTWFRPWFGRFHRERIDFCNGISRFCYEWRRHWHITSHNALPSDTTPGPQKDGGSSWAYCDDANLHLNVVDKLLTTMSMD